MPSDRLLNTVLGAYQQSHDADQTNRLLSSTTSLLTTLSNPLNVTLLTSHLLTAPAVWSQLNGLQSCLRIISIFNTAAITVRQNEIDARTGQGTRQGGGISCDDWARAVIKGADDKSARWQHLLVIGGVLIGMEGQERHGLSQSLRSTLEGALVTAANLALQDPARDGVVGAESIVLVLNHTFPLILNVHARALNYDALAPILVRAMVGNEGYQEGLFLGPIDLDVKQSGNRFEWSQKSVSFRQIQQLGARPLVSSMGSLSRLLAHSIDNLADSRKVMAILDDMVRFAASLQNQWRRCKLSEVDSSEEALYLTDETRRVTFSALIQVLKTAMFANVVVLRAIVGRVLVDPVLASDILAPGVAAKALHVLRNLFFITTRLGSNAFTAYTFVYLASIDILTRFPMNSKIFLTEIQPHSPGNLPSHPLDRVLDLFYLNTCEHFSLVLDPADNEHLIVAAASPYLNPSANKALLEIFEAAHSAVLSALSAPHNTNLTAKVIPFYTDALFKSFPTNLSPRQFRFAFKTLLQLTTPPSPLSATNPELPEILCEVLYDRAKHAPTTPLPPSLTLRSEADAKEKEAAIALSEQTVLLLTLLDALPFLPLPLLEEWLPLSADLLNSIEDRGMREVGKRRFWEVLESGEMDVERSGVSVAWWTTRGGREMVLYGHESMQAQDAGPFMSGGLGPLVKDSRL